MQVWIEPAERLSESAKRQADAAIRRPAGGGVEEDRGAKAGHDGAAVVLDHGEVPVRGRLLPERLATSAERRRCAAGDVAKAVVRGRAGIAIPPVSASESMKSEANAGVVAESVDDWPEAEGAGRRRAVALVM